MGVFDKLFYQRVLDRWSKAARAARQTDLSTLRRQRSRAKQLQARLNELIAVAESRLALPLIGTKAMRRPAGSDWSWRPQLWREPLMTPGYASVENKTSFGPEATIFHDCKVTELTVRQLRNHRDSDLAPFGMRMDVFRFDGSYLSMVVDLPEEAAQGLKKRHLVRMDTIVEMEKPLEIFARLNVKHGPNTEQIVRELPLHEEEVMVEFDLAYTKMNEKRVERMWVDLIFEGPEMNQIILRDVTFSRRPRAEL
ncbi:DUF6478 family protein [Cognatishimia sp. MH4019]|uniref:DUF6478 family protein n=1 Tax=Cognatishimia sp. MH4019 TaxID=2854030 RepID=UPI001CD5D037|nr:DUF6478 family protein [Cognatishimia sp. MH4019]